MSPRGSRHSPAIGISGLRDLDHHAQPVHRHTSSRMTCPDIPMDKLRHQDGFRTSPRSGSTYSPPAASSVEGPHRLRPAQPLGFRPPRTPAPDVFAPTSKRSRRPRSGSRPSWSERWVHFKGARWTKPRSSYRAQHLWWRETQPDARPAQSRRLRCLR